MLFPGFFIFVVRPAGFEPAAYAFEVQESENSKTSWLQSVESIQLFEPIFGFFWNCLGIYDLDGHNLGTGQVNNSNFVCAIKMV